MALSEEPCPEPCSAGTSVASKAGHIADSTTMQGSIRAGAAVCCDVAEGHLNSSPPPSDLVRSLEDELKRGILKTKQLKEAACNPCKGTEADRILRDNSWGDLRNSVGGAQVRTELASMQQNMHNAPWSTGSANSTAAATPWLGSDCSEGNTAMSPPMSESVSEVRSWRRRSAGKTSLADEESTWDALTASSNSTVPPALPVLHGSMVLAAPTTNSSAMLLPTPEDLIVRPEDIVNKSNNVCNLRLSWFYDEDIVEQVAFSSGFSLTFEVRQQSKGTNGRLRTRTHTCRCVLPERIGAEVPEQSCEIEGCVPSRVYLLSVRACAERIEGSTEGVAAVPYTSAWSEIVRACAPQADLQPCAATAAAGLVNDELTCEAEVDYIRGRCGSRWMQEPEEQLQQVIEEDISFQQSAGDQTSHLPERFEEQLQQAAQAGYGRSLNGRVPNADKVLTEQAHEAARTSHGQSLNFQTPSADDALMEAMVIHDRLERLKQQGLDSVQSLVRQRQEQNERPTEVSDMPDSAAGLGCGVRQRPRVNESTAQPNYGHGWRVFHTPELGRCQSESRVVNEYQECTYAGAKCQSPMDFQVSGHLRTPFMTNMDTIDIRQCASQEDRSNVPQIGADSSQGVCPHGSIGSIVTKTHATSSSVSLISAATHPPHWQYLVDNVPTTPESRHAPPLSLPQSPGSLLSVDEAAEPMTRARQVGAVAAQIAAQIAVAAVRGDPCPGSPVPVPPAPRLATRREVSENVESIAAWRASVTAPEARVLTAVSLVGHVNGTGSMSPLVPATAVAHDCPPPQSRVIRGASAPVLPGNETSPLRGDALEPNVEPMAQVPTSRPCAPLAASGRDSVRSVSPPAGVLPVQRRSTSPPNTSRPCAPFIRDCGSAMSPPLEALLAHRRATSPPLPACRLSTPSARHAGGNCGMSPPPAALSTQRAALSPPPPQIVQSTQCAKPTCRRCSAQQEIDKTALASIQRSRSFQAQDHPSRSPAGGSLELPPPPRGQLANNGSMSLAFPYQLKDNLGVNPWAGVASGAVNTAGSGLLQPQHRPRSLSPQGHNSNVDHSALLARGALTSRTGNECRTPGPPPPSVNSLVPNSVLRSKSGPVTGLPAAPMTRSSWSRPEVIASVVTAGGTVCVGPGGAPPSTGGTVCVGPAAAPPMAAQSGQAVPAAQTMPPPHMQATRTTTLPGTSLSPRVRAVEAKAPGIHSPPRPWTPAGMPAATAAKASSLAATPPAGPKAVFPQAVPQRQSPRMQQFLAAAPAIIPAINQAPLNTSRPSFSGPVASSKAGAPARAAATAEEHELPPPRTAPGFEADFAKSPPPMPSALFQPGSAGSPLPPPRTAPAARALGIGVASEVCSGAQPSTNGYALRLRTTDRSWERLAFNVDSDLEVLSSQFLRSTGLKPTLKAGLCAKMRRMLSEGRRVASVDVVDLI